MPNDNVVTTFPISQLKVHAKLDMRGAKPDAATVARYARMMVGGEELPPILVAQTGKNHYIVDGHHRCAAAASLGLVTVPTIKRRMSIPEAREAAWQANLRHGEPPGQVSRRQLFDQYIAMGKHLEDDGLGGQKLKHRADIARDLAGVYSRTYVYQLLRTHGLVNADDGYDGPSYWDNDRGDDGDIDGDNAEPIVDPSDAEALAAINGHLEEIGVALSIIRSPATASEARETIRSYLVGYAPESKLDI